MSRRIIDDAITDNSQVVVDHKKPKRGCSIINWVIRGVIVIVLIAVLIITIVMRKQLLSFLGGVVEWVRDNPIAGPIILMLCCIVATIFFIPGLLLTLSTGYPLQSAYQKIYGKDFHHKYR